MKYFPLTWSVACQVVVRLIPIVNEEVQESKTDSMEGCTWVFREVAWLMNLFIVDGMPVF